MQVALEMGSIHHVQHSIDYDFHDHRIEDVTDDSKHSLDNTAFDMCA